MFEEGEFLADGELRIPGSVLVMSPRASSNWAVKEGSCSACILLLFDPSCLKVSLTVILAAADPEAAALI